ncbi:unnamed protein product [Tetraodon nigroviridis]|uniref:(spotted green pufferfish) hypothetical protein n=1 Tax=Tetraodon nigroviridis TaxID=99883 RepID=Q4RKD8_TETNG|nr:unnamed protein product [Tetraodon nigroviridis]
MEQGDGPHIPLDVGRNLRRRHPFRANAYHFQTEEENMDWWDGTYDGGTRFGQTRITFRPRRRTWTGWNTASDWSSRKWRWSS